MVEEDGDDYAFLDHLPHEQQNVLIVAELKALKYVYFLLLPVPLKTVSTI